jgi:tripartite-type tricarboxylate transporter receptor subunit TctC
MAFRHFVVTLALLFAALATQIDVSHSRSFPSKPVTLIVPWPAGGTTDIAMRSLAKVTEKHLGVAIVVENRPGASGLVALTHVARSASRDGYSIMQLPISALHAPLLREIDLDPVQELSFIIGLTGYSFGVVVRHDAPWKTFQELIADARANPKKIKFGTPGTGTTPHDVMTKIAAMRGIDWIHIPFKGSSETTSSLLGGHIDVVADGTSWASLVADGTFRLLVIWDSERSSHWPDVPTLKDIGINLVANAPYGLVGPKDVDPKNIQLLHDSFKRGMEDDDFLNVLSRLNQKPIYMNGQQYREFAVQEVANHGQFLRSLRSE